METLQSNNGADAKRMLVCSLAGFEPVPLDLTPDPIALLDAELAARGEFAVELDDADLEYLRFDDDTTAAAPIESPEVMAADDALPTFSPEDEAYLLARATNLKVAREQGARTASQSMVRAATRIPTVVGSGLLFCYPHTNYARAQLHDREANGCKTIAPAGVTPPPFIPTTVDSAGDDLLLFVESPGKAITMVSHGFHNTIGCSGVNAGYFEKGTTKFQAALLPFIRTSRPVTIVFDAGRLNNARVALAEARLARALLDLKVNVSVCELPLTDAGADQGPDDFIAAHGRDALQRLIDSAAPAEPRGWAKSASAETPRARAMLSSKPFVAALTLVSPKEQEQVATILGGFFGKRDIAKATSAFLKGLATSSRSRESMNVTVLERGDEVEIGRRFTDEQGEHFVFAEGEFYAYDPAGVWRRRSYGECSSIIQGYAGMPVRSGADVRPLKMQATTCHGALSLASERCEQPRFFDDAPRGLSFKNGFLALNEERVVLLPHEASHRARFRHEVEFDPERACPDWMDFLTSVWDGAEDADARISALQELVGAALFGLAPRFKKCIVLYGETDSGKSTCLDIVRGLFPPDTATSIEPSKFGHHFDRADLAGKLLNTVPELPATEWMDASAFKALVSSDPIRARHPYGRSFQFLPTAGHLFGANNLPRVSERGEAVWNRILVLHFQRRFHRQPTGDQKQAVHNLAVRILRADLVGIIAWAARGLERLLAAQGAFTVPPSSLDLLEEWREDSDQVLQFFREQIELTNLPGAQLGVTEVFDAYRNWAEMAGHRFPLAMRNFGKEFGRILARELKRERSRHKSHGAMVYENVKWAASHSVQTRDLTGFLKGAAVRPNGGRTKTN